VDCHKRKKERGQGHAKQNPTPTATLLLSPFPNPAAELSRALIVTRHINRPATLSCPRPRTGCALSILFVGVSVPLSRLESAAIHAHLGNTSSLPEDRAVRHSPRPLSSLVLIIIHRSGCPGRLVERCQCRQAPVTPFHSHSKPTNTLWPDLHTAAMVWMVWTSKQHHPQRRS